MDIHEYPFIPEMARFWALAFFAFGSCIGSFLNVCIWRIPRGESIVSPPSRCPKCGHSIAWHENIPMLSWLLLRGKCSSCSAPISPRYFIVELATGILFTSIFLKAFNCGEPLTAMPVYLLMASLAITTAFIDCELRIIPNETTYLGMAAGLALAFAFPETWHLKWRLPALALSASSMALAGGLMALASILGRSIFKREALGWGDVKYIAAVGACLGFPAAFFAVFAGSLMGMVWSFAKPMLPGRRRRRSIAFGPSLATGVLIWIFFGAWILKSYLELSAFLHGR